MTIASISFRQKLPPVSAAIIRSHRYIFTSSVFARQQQNPSNVRRPQQQQQPQRNLLKARETLKKQFSSLAPVLSPNDTPPLSENQAIGTVSSAQANFMRVVVDSLPMESSRNENSASSSGVELLCYVKAVLKKIKRRVVVGDQVLVGSIDWVDRRGMIENVYERKSVIFDPPVANIDHFLVLFSLDEPKLEPFMLTRFLVEAESTELPLTIALNKTELVDEEMLSEWKTRLRSWGYEPVLCSVDTKQGLDTLQFILRDQMSVIVGPSGVGKSSLINALRVNQSGFRAAEDDNWFETILGNKWFEEQRVGEVSTRSGRGKHTTRNVSLLPLSGGGYLADTPGFNQPSLMKVTAQSLAHHFPEIQKMLVDNGPGKCSFSNCLHIGEPGCLVKGDWERYPYYLQLLDEIKIREEFQLRTVGTKREGDVRFKVGGLGIKQAEPRLELKKHRRQSRKKLNQSLLDELDELDDDDDNEEDGTPILGM
ncbi:small ribosomal subunit biogenesis GTPase RsgA 1, mitochondrial [Henckelia pumila]|uniref:small ribosomal subunit biogenesis GTPase RsgA 1, mitochondrial n=1 Tax=Henckelia pumila TaxID=405737 RepID=UPI003C6E23F4